MGIRLIDSFLIINKNVLKYFKYQRFNSNQYCNIWISFLNYNNNKLKLKPYNA